LFAIVSCGFKWFVSQLTGTRYKAQGARGKNICFCLKPYALRLMPLGLNDLNVFWGIYKDCAIRLEYVERFSGFY